MFNNKLVLAIIPARGGSKGIKNKNLSIIEGKTLVAHAIECAQQSDVIDEIVVSSDSEQILSEAVSYGVNVTFKRPEYLSGDDIPALPVWQHAWKTHEAIVNRDFKISVWLQPTSPLRNCNDIIKTVSPVAFDSCDSAVTVSKVPEHYAPEKIMLMDSSNTLNRYLNDKYISDLRQDIKSYYFRNGHCYCCNKKALFNEHAIISQQCQSIVIDRLTVNIDYKEELDYARYLFKKNTP